MSSLIVAKFHNQFAAASAFDKLMSRGLRRQRGTVQCDESVGRSAASASAPTTVVSQLSHRGERAGEKQAVRSPDALPSPVEIGFAVLTVEIDDDGALEEVMDVMRGLDALDVHILPGQTLHQDDAALWPELEVGSGVDVDRAVRASLRGKPRVH